MPASLVTGKTWADMTPTERYAHQIARGTGDLTDAQRAEGQAWLDENIGDYNTQQYLFRTVRDAAIDRIEDGTFAGDEDRAAAAQDIAQQPTYSLDDYLTSIEWDGTKDKYGRNAATIWQDVGEYGIDGGNFGFNERDVESYFSDLLGHNDPKPAWDGSGTRVGTSGGAAGIVGDPITPQGGDPAGNPDAIVPEVNPTLPDYGDPFAPPPTAQPPTGQPPAGGGDPFAPTAPPPSGSGYIDSFLPGSRNDQFYTDQFNRLAGQNYDFQNQQAMANQMRQEAAQQPAQGMPKDPFAWMDYQLPEVEVNDRGYANPFPGYEGNVGSQNNGQYFNPWTGQTVSTPVYGGGAFYGGLTQQL